MSVFEHSELGLQRIVFLQLESVLSLPADLAASLAVSILKGSPFKQTIVCLYDEDNYKAYDELLS